MFEVEAYRVVVEVWRLFDETKEFCGSIIPGRQLLVTEWNIYDSLAYILYLHTFWLWRGKRCREMAWPPTLQVLRHGTQIFCPLASLQRMCGIDWICPTTNIYLSHTWKERLGYTHTHVHCIPHQTMHRKSCHRFGVSIHLSTCPRLHTNFLMLIGHLVVIIGVDLHYVTLRSWCWFLWPGILRPGSR